MDVFSEATQHLNMLRRVLGEDCDIDGVAATTAALADTDLLSVIAETTAVITAMEKVRIIASGVTASRSTRGHGHTGLAQSTGHRTPVELLQELTGMSRSGAAKHVRLGESLLATIETPQGDVDRSEHEAGHGEHDADAQPWHAGLSRALLTGMISADQHDVILRGLGNPPPAAAPGDGISADPDAVAAWSAAASQLIDEAECRTVEELARAARSVRDTLDPAGAQERFSARHEARSFRLRTGEDGTTRGYLSFDDEGAAWMSTIVNSALRPRRGGPRFVDPAENERAEQLATDPRSNDQLAYDLIMDVLRAGSLADAETVFGTRQAGVRIVTVIDHVSGTGRAAHLEEDGSSIPASFAAKHRCDTGFRECTIDRDGNPLHLGREQRLFSPKQKIAMALRDGGCRWRRCDRPASYCEAHHIDEWKADGGRTDVDRGILLCRFHHMQLHHSGWRITRQSLDDFVLHPPGNRASITLRPREALRAAWAGIDPPRKRFPTAA